MMYSIIFWHGVPRPCAATQYCSRLIIGQHAFSSRIHVHRQMTMPMGYDGKGEVLESRRLFPSIRPLTDRNSVMNGRDPLHSEVLMICPLPQPISASVLLDVSPPQASELPSLFTHVLRPH